MDLAEYAKIYLNIYIRGMSRRYSLSPPPLLAIAAAAVFAALC